MSEIPHICGDCCGQGWYPVYRTIAVAGCCGNALPSGECCGNAIPVPEEVEDQEPCEHCNGTGVIIADHRRDMNR